MAESEFPAELFSSVGLDIDAILAPLAEGEGGGVDVRYSPEIDALAEARREDDTTAQGIWQKEIKRADWRAVITLAAEILATKSKDLQTAVWLCQGLINVHGLQGLAAGLETLARLTRQFWPVLWPRPDGQDWEPRLTPYFWIDIHLNGELLKVEVTEPVEGTRAGVTYQTVMKARQLQQLAANRPRTFQEAVAEGELSFADLDNIIRGTSNEFLKDHQRQARLGLAALQHLQDALDKAIAAEAPSFANFKQTLQDIERLFAQVLSARGAGAPAAPPPVAEPAPKSAAKSKKREEPSPMSSPGLPQIQDRHAAYALLDHAANWLLEHEPHSPAPYLVKRAVSWEGLGLRELLAQLMMRGADLELIYQILGIGEDGQAANSGKRRVSVFNNE